MRVERFVNSGLLVDDPLGYWDLVVAPRTERALAPDDDGYPFPFYLLFQLFKKKKLHDTGSSKGYPLGRVVRGSLWWSLRAAVPIQSGRTFRGCPKTDRWKWRSFANGPGIWRRAFNSSSTYTSPSRRMGISIFYSAIYASRSSKIVHGYYFVSRCRLVLSLFPDTADHSLIHFQLLPDASFVVLYCGLSRLV